MTTGIAPLARWPWLFVALRYLGAVRATRGVSFVSTVSIAGLVLGVAALITVLSVMNGFDGELRGRILGIVPQLVVEPPPTIDARELEAARQRLLAEPEVAAVGRQLELQGMVSSSRRVLPIALVGIEGAREAELSPLPEAMTYGDLSVLDADDAVVLGVPLAARLGLLPGDSLRFVLPRASGESVAPQLVSRRVEGLFRFGAEPDHLLAFTDVDGLAAVTGGAVPSLRARLEDVFAAPRLAARLRADPAWVGWEISDWTRRYGELFAAVGMEKTMMGLLLGLIVAIAVFNIVASLAMLVDEKRGAIAILRTLGASRREIVSVFLLQGAVVGAVGTLAGGLLGVLLAYNIGDLMAVLERSFGFRLLAGTYFDRLPSQVFASDVLLVMGASFGLAMLGALHPARRAGEADPAPALHGL